MKKTLYRKAGCSDCQTMWNGYCPLCKELGNMYFDEDGNRVRRKQMTAQGVRRINRFHWLTAIVGVKEKRPQQRAAIKKGFSDDKKYWMTKHPRRVVTLILRGHDAACLCCLTLDSLTFDHIIPISKGGINGLSNGQILCKSCNVIKDNKIIEIKELRKEMNL